MKTLKMIFSIGGSTKVTKSLADPKDGLTAAEVKTAMQECVTDSFFVFGGAAIDAISRAYIEEVTTTELEVA